MNTNCATWASIGECESNPSYMKTQCPVTCRLCQSDDCHDELDDCAERARGPATSNFSAQWGCYNEPELMKKKCAWTCLACDLKFVPPCKRDRDVTPAATPGSVNRMFERLSKSNGATVLSSDPWVVTLDHFLSDEEADGLLASASTGQPWSRSKAGDGVQEARTSSTAWCSGSCVNNPVVQDVQKRVEALTGVPTVYSEFMQLLEYKEGQFYKVHHDQNSPRSSAWGPRMYTFFMYLSDGYTGGHTHFPRLNITVEAAKGRALVWTSVLDSDPYERDDRTDHESQPVISGVKYAANYWLHMYPFRTKSGTCGNTAYADNWY